VKGRTTQRERILHLLASANGRWVQLPEILQLGCAQFGARLLELRRSGYDIRNKTERKNGKLMSWYRLETTKEPRVIPTATSSPVIDQAALFSSDTPTSWADPEEDIRG
jgi:hypothetical protein